MKVLNNTLFVLIIAGLIALGFALLPGCAGSKFQSCFIDCSQSVPQGNSTVTEFNDENIGTWCWTLDLTKLPEHIQAALAGVDPAEIIGRIIYWERISGQGCLGEEGSQFRFYTTEPDKDISFELELYAPGSAVELK